MDINQKFQIGQKVCFWNTYRIIEGIIAGVSRKYNAKNPKYEIAFFGTKDNIVVRETSEDEVFNSLQDLLDYHTKMAFRLSDKQMAKIQNYFQPNSVDVVDAEVITDYILKVFFSNDECRIIDFGDYIRNNKNPLIKQYTDKEKFGKCRVVNGVLTWNNDMDFDPEALLKGTISGLQYINNTRDDD